MKSLVIYAASGCNLRCKHCGVGSDQVHPRPVSSVVNLLNAARAAKQANVTSVTLIGGEPTFARNDLHIFLAEAENLGLKVSINTNLLEYDPIKSLLNFSSLQNITVSLDGASPETHDNIRGKGTFMKTYNNIVRLHEEFRSRQDKGTIDITFVLNNINKSENTAIIDIANRIGVNTLNVDTLAYKGFAAANRDRLEIEGRDLIVALTALYIYWLMEGKVDLDIYIPPVFAAFLRERYGFSKIAENASGCGGISVYGYIDHYGNHLPCPSMAFEQNNCSTVIKESDRLSVNANSLSEVWETSLFLGFERSRSASYLRRRQQPCNVCHFVDACSPCTAGVIEKRERPVVVICQALKDFGDEFLPNFSGRYFG
jgi:MoaA/NifB/PqqE/SkfB family radical SAM enzyme